MAKLKNNSPQAVRNRNNRARGAKFEKKVADELGMFVVPYSGSNARFGYGDIRDVEGTQGGIWLGECKNITSDGRGYVTIKKDWLIDLKKKADSYGLIPFLAFMRKGKPEKYIIVDQDTYHKICTHQLHHLLTLPKKVHNVVNFIMGEDELKHTKDGTVVCIRHEGDGDNWYHMMELKRFKELIIAKGLHTKYRS